MSISNYVPFDASFLVPPNATEFRVANNYFNGNTAVSLVLSNHPTCKQVIIGDSSFRKVRQFELSGLPELEGIVIGKNSFTNATTHDDTISYSDTPGGVCRIVTCPKLKSIQIGYGSFYDYYYSFEVTNLQSLQSIQIEDWCFCKTSSFSLTSMNEYVSNDLDLPHILSVYVGNDVFEHAYYILFDSNEFLIPITNRSSRTDNY